MIRPFLMFQGKKAEEAIDFYCSLFADSAVLDLVRYGKDGPGPEGTVMKATFSLRGQHVMCSDSFVEHAFTFTPSFSFFVDCANDEEIERLTSRLAEGGSTLMPLGAYGFSRRFAWVADRFGVSWQLNLA